MPNNDAGDSQQISRADDVWARQLIEKIDAALEATKSISAAKCLPVSRIKSAAQADIGLLELKVLLLQFVL